MSKTKSQFQFKFKEDDFVSFNTGESSGYGYIKGIASLPHPLVNTSYIIQLEVIIDHENEFSHEYSCIAVFEQFIKRRTRHTTLSVD